MCLSSRRSSAAFNSATTASASSATTDTVSITEALYAAGDRVLNVTATSSSAAATLQVFVASTGALIGKLSNDGSGRYRGQFSWPSNPQSITVKSSLGGSATRTVTLD